MERNRVERILCVSDDTEECDVLTNTLPLLKFTFANSYSTARQLVHTSIFDLYLLDECIPDASGIELCREVRKIDANTPVVLFSPAGHNPNPDSAFSAGASAYLDMPAEFFRLESTVVGLLREADARSMDARLAEIRALQTEIRQHLAQIDGSKRDNTERIMRANDHLFRARAYAAFTNSGGVRSHFERLWPDVLIDYSRSC